MELPFRPDLLDLRDNRLKGLMSEIMDAIADCEDPVLLYRTGINLKLMHDAARGKAWEINPKKGNRSW